MATYVNNLRLKEIATGDESGTWGTSTNTNLELIGEALGIGTEAITTNADTHSTVVADGSADAGRAMYLKYTGTLDSACTITITPNTMKRVQIIENATSGSQNIIISQGSGANVTIGNGKVAIVQLDGAGSGAAVLDALTDLQVTDTLSVNGTTITLGDGTAEDTKLVFDGNAQDFYIGLDDSADDLLIGLGSTVGTTPIISVDENKDVAIPDGGLTITTSDNTDQLSLISTDADSAVGPNLRMYRNSGSPADGDMLGAIEFEGRNDNSQDVIYAELFSETYDVTDADSAVGPNLRMYRNSGSPADGDMLGAIEFEGRNDNSQDVIYAELFSETYDVSDGTEDGRFFIKTMVGGTRTHRMYMNFNETNFNEGGGDIDFRVESNGSANMLFIDGGNNNVHIANNSTGFHSSVQPLIVGSGSGDEGMAIFSGSSNKGKIGFADAATDDSGSYRGYFQYDHSGDNLNIGTAGSEVMRIDSSGKVGIGTTSPSAMLHLYKATGSGALEPELIIENNHNTSSVTDGAGRLTFYSDDSNNSGIPDNAWLGQVRFMGDDKDGSATEFEYAYMVGQARDAGSGTSRKGGLSFYTRNGNSITETVTITEDKVGIGTTSPQKILHTASNGIRIDRGGGGSYWDIGPDGTNDFKFVPNGSEVARITTDGNLLLGTTSNYSPAGRMAVKSIANGGTTPVASFQANTSTSSGSLIVFYSGDGSEVGSIGMSNLNAGSAVAYNTSSDARLKDVTGEAKGLEVINALKPVAFNWKSDNAEDEGLLAQEVKEIVPNAVSQGEDEYYQMDYSKLVTPLIKAVQELSAEVEQLKQQAHDKCEN